MVDVRTGPGGQPAALQIETNGNRLPAFASWLLTVGWETVLTVLATFATAATISRWRAARRPGKGTGRR